MRKMCEKGTPLFEFVYSPEMFCLVGHVIAL